MSFCISVHTQKWNQSKRRHERILEALNSAGHDGNNIETLLTCFFYFKIQSYNSCVACALHYKNIRLCMGLKVHSLVWMVDISLKILVPACPPVKSFSHVNSNKSSCTIVVLFCKIQAYFMFPNDHAILNMCFLRDMPI